MTLSLSLYLFGFDAVMMRILLMQMNLKPYIDPVTVFVLVRLPTPFRRSPMVVFFFYSGHLLFVSVQDPDGYIMRRWPSRYPRNGRRRCCFF